jgi:hypothetical protein
MADENEMQLEFARENDAPYFETLHLHSSCFAAWEMERAA